MAIQSDDITPTRPNQREEGAPEDRRVEAQDADTGSDWIAAHLRDNRQERQVCVRLDAERFAMLEDKAMRAGVAPTTMARMLVHRGLRAEEDAWE